MMTPQELFQVTLTHVLGQALSAAHFLPEDNALQQARGLFRFRKVLAENSYGFIEFQMLYHDQSGLSRFRVQLIRTDQPHAHAGSSARIEKTLAAIIWHDFAARVLPSDDHWWLYKQQQDLAYELIDAGKLLFGYGVPWLEGDSSV